jgi:TetR/AcrR family transcriptional regulator
LLKLTALALEEGANCKDLLSKELEEKRMNTEPKNKKAQLIEQRKEQILATAKRIFAQNSYRRTKIDQIADTLEVGKGTIYRYFKDKKSLFLAVFEQGISQLRQIIRTDVEPIVDPKQKMAAAVKIFFEFFDNDRELIEIMMQVRSEFKDDYRRVFLASYSDYIVKIQENLRTGIGMGIFRNLDVEKTAEAISAALQGVLQSFYVREFGSETVMPEAEKGFSTYYDSAKAKDELSRTGQRKKSLTDGIEAVTALLLEGLLKREEKVS